jgi:hypothetical protein
VVEGPSFDAPESTTVGACVVCSGDIVREVRHEEIGDPWHVRFGQRVPMRTVVGYHCAACGLMYRHPPRGAGQGGG